MNTVVYLYGFVPADALAPPADVGGIGGRPVELVDLGGMRAAVAQLPATEFSAERIEPRLEELGWVGEQGVAHERVVVWFADHSEILPARMFSIYSGEPALRSAVAPDLPRLREQLRELTGKREWNLKVGYDADALARNAAEVSDAIGSIDEEIADAPPGRRYLLERKRADLLKTEVARAARRIANAMLDSLAPLAADVRVLPVTSDEPAGSVVLNAALLVDRRSERQLREYAAELHGRNTALGMVVSFSGPWAPYRFVEQNVGT